MHMQHLEEHTKERKPPPFAWRQIYTEPQSRLTGPKGCHRMGADKALPHIFVCKRPCFCVISSVSILSVRTRSSAHVCVPQALCTQVLGLVEGFKVSIPSFVWHSHQDSRVRLMTVIVELSSSQRYRIKTPFRSDKQTATVNSSCPRR